MKVSWMVTGIRQDAYAKANPIDAVQDKDTKDRGKYLHPEAFDLPSSMKIGHDEEKDKGHEHMESKQIEPYVVTVPENRQVKGAGMSNLREVEGDISVRKDSK